MQIGGIQNYSFIDYPGNISCVVFTQGCNFKCSYCHNKQLWEEKEGSIKEDEFFEFLNKRADFIEAVVISGGEPTMQSTHLLSFVRKIKKLGFKIKLDTNGSSPETLRIVLPYLDYVAMDIKTCVNAEKYSKVCGANVNIKDIKESMMLILKSKIKYHFRTTVDYDLISKEDEEQIKKELGKTIHIFQCKK